MKKIRRPFAIALCVLMMVACVPQVASAETAPNPKFIMVGDSIVASGGAGGSTGTQGWGSVFAQWFDGVTVDNRAMAGRSAKQYYNEARYNQMLNAVNPGDVVFVQWGHNDACYARAARYAPVGDMDIAGTYQNYLAIYVRDIRGKGGIPVLVTVPATHNNSLWYGPVYGPDGPNPNNPDNDPARAAMLNGPSSEAMFYDPAAGRFLPSFPNYANGSREVAKALDVPLVDLNKLTMDYFNALPNKAEGVLYSDGVHLTAAGAADVARLVAQNMVTKRIPGFEYVKPAVALPTSWKFDIGGATEGYTPIEVNSAYSPLKGYGWQMNDVYPTLRLTTQTNEDPLRQAYISGDIKGEGENAPQEVNGTGESRRYTYPTFLIDLPVGIYDVKVTIGRETGNYNSGAKIEGVMNAVAWCNYPADGNTANFRASTARTAGTYVANNFRVAVWDGQLTVELASFEGNANAISMACGVEIAPAEPLGAGAKPTVHIVGDSTAAQGGGGTSVGYGSRLPSFFTDDVVFNNRAVSGLASRTYIGGGNLNALLTTYVKPGDYIFIDWGHNDFSRERTGRYADPSPGGLFEQTMQKYVDAAKAFGATPVLLAPVNQYYNGDPTRIGASGYNRYTKEWIGVSFVDWRARDRDIAEREGIAFLDITPIMADYIQGLGFDATASLFYDGTHLSSAGADWAASNYSLLLARTDSALAACSIFRTDKDALLAAINEAEKLNPDDYADFSAVAQALAEAKAVCANEMAVQSEVDNALSALRAAIDTLELVQLRLNVEVGVASIVETLAAYIPVTVTAAEGSLDGAKLTAYLKVGGELLYPAEAVGGRARVYVAQAPAAGTYEIVVLAEGLTTKGSGQIEVVEYNTNIWTATAFSGEGGLLNVSFNAKISSRTNFANAVTIAGSAYSAAVLGGNVLAVPVAYDSIADGARIVITGVKYPELFPSYSFTFAVTK